MRLMTWRLLAFFLAFPMAGALWAAEVKVMISAGFFGPSGEPVAAVVARGESAIGFPQVSELIHVKGVDYVGPLPAELQPGFSFAGSVTTNAQQPEAAAALIRFLSSAEAAPVITKAGLAPVPAR